MMESKTRVFSKKTRRGKIALIVREHYLRVDLAEDFLIELSSHEDIPCYVVPDINFTVRYLEILEAREVTDIIFLKTVVNEAQQISQRLYNRIKTLLKDARKRCIFFNNENFQFTWVEREANESAEQRNERAIASACKWIVDNVKIVPFLLISDSERLRGLVKSLTNEKNFFTYSSFDYVHNCKYTKHFPASLKELHHSLSLLVQQEEEEKNKPKASGSDSDRIYEEYLTEEVLEAGIKSEIIFRGTLRVNAHNPDEATIRIDEKHGMGRELFIPGKVYRNRAIHGDTVAVQLVPQSEWSAPSRTLKKIDEEEEAEASGTRTTTPHRRTMPTGKVVGILSRNWRDYVCVLQIDTDKESKESMALQERVLCIPMDYKIPKIRIRSRQASELVNSRIVVRIDSWDINSYYPNGHYVYQLGEIGKLETENAALLVENGIVISPFSKNMLADIPSLGSDNKWELPAEEVAKRRDFRKERVYSIDPKGSQDIDDALSVKFLSKGRFQIGVHIADVNYFIKRESPLDFEARARGTTVYLADRKFDMIPQSLSEILASLRENVDRPAVSVLWDFNEQLQVTNVWFGRSAIRSCHELYYELAQSILDGTCSQVERKKLSDYDLLKKELEQLTIVARKLREDRLKRGALELDSTEIRFEMNDSKDPAKLLAKKSQEINAVVAEFMILANSAVAEKLYSVYPTCALLRHHPLPRTNRFEELIKVAISKGFQIDATSNKSLAKSLLNAQLPTDSSFNQLLRILTVHAMEEAEYISSGSYNVDQFYHYGLATDFYTHFTSPIRRYADTIVHRQLLDALQQPPAEAYMNDLQLTELCNHLNQKNRNAKQAQRDSVELFQALYFAKKQEIHDAVIYELKDNGFLVFVPKYALKGSVFLRDKNGTLLIPENALSLSPGKYKSSTRIYNFSVDENKESLILTTSSGPVAVPLFDHVTVKITVGESRAHRTPLKFELVHFGQDPSLVDTTVKMDQSKRDVQIRMEQAIREEEEEQAKQWKQRGPEINLKDYASSGEEDMYLVFEGIKNLSLEEDKENEVQPPEQGTRDMTTRYWKLKKRPKPQHYQLIADSVEDDDHETGESITDEELIQKRLDMEERQRERMPVEQRFHEQIGKLELKIRGMRKK